MYTNPSTVEALARPSLDSGLSDSNTAQRQNPNDAAGPRTPPKRLRASTEAAYAKDLRLFMAAGGTVPCDVAALHRYLAKMGKRLSPTTLHRRLMAVRYGHISRGQSSPTNDPSMRATMRTLQAGYLPGKIPAASLAQTGNENVRRKAPESAKPITRATLLRMLMQCIDPCSTTVTVRCCSSDLRRRSAEANWLGSMSRILRSRRMRCWLRSERVMKQPHPSERWGPIAWHGNSPSPSPVVSFALRQRYVLGLLMRRSIQVPPTSHGHYSSVSTGAAIQRSIASTAHSYPKY